MKFLYFILTSLILTSNLTFADRVIDTVITKRYKTNMDSFPIRECEKGRAKVTLTNRESDTYRLEENNYDIHPFTLNETIRTYTKTVWVQHEVGYQIIERIGDGSESNWGRFFNTHYSRKPSVLSSLVRGINYQQAQVIVDKNYLDRKPRSWNDFIDKMENAERNDYSTRTEWVNGDGSESNWGGFYNAPTYERADILASLVKGIGNTSAEAIVNGNYLHSKPRSWSSFLNVMRRVDAANPNLNVEANVQQYARDNQVALGYLVRKTIRIPGPLKGMVNDILYHKQYNKYALGYLYEDQESYHNSGPKSSRSSEHVHLREVRESDHFSAAIDVNLKLLSAEKLLVSFAFGCNEKQEYKVSVSSPENSYQVSYLGGEKNAPHFSAKRIQKSPTNTLFVNTTLVSGELVLRDIKDTSHDPIIYQELMNNNGSVTIEGKVSEKLPSYNWWTKAEEQSFTVQWDGTANAKIPTGVKVQDINEVNVEFRIRFSGSSYLNDKYTRYKEI